jgi:hypothetical protein
MLGERLELNATVGRFLDLGGPLRLPHADVVQRRNPGRIGEGGLRVRRQRQGSERERGKGQPAEWDH